MREIARPLLALMGTLFLSACASIVYSGDGRLRDRGPLAGLNRYVVDLGPVDLRQTGTYSYQMRTFPQVEMMVGFDVIFDAPPSFALRERPITAVVALQLEAPDGSLLVDETSRLNSWGWGERSDEPTIRFLWRSPGTTFKPAVNGTYTIKVRVIEPDTGTLQYRTRIAAKGGGWQQ